MSCLGWGRHEVVTKIPNFFPLLFHNCDDVTIHFFSHTQLCEKECKGTDQDGMTSSLPWRTCINISARENMRLPQRAAQLGLSHFLLAKDIFNGPMAWLLLLKFS